VRALQTVEKLDALPVTDEAFRAGRLSEVQAHEIAGAAAKDPTAESRLVHAARRHHLKGLKEECRRVRAAAEADDTAWAERLHRNRRLRMWTEADGAPAGIWRLAPESGAAVKAAIDAETDLLFREARKDGRRESRDAYAADALHALITRGPRKASSAHLVADQTAIDRGYVERGERCEITGIGPVPVTVAKTMLVDAKIREVPHAAALPEFTSTGRYYPAWMTAWLDTRYPVCGVEGCDAEFRLQYDHVVAREDGGLTELDNLWRLCPYHHSLKTNRGWQVTGTTHEWNLVPPDQSDATDDPDPP